MKTSQIIEKALKTGIIPESEILLLKRRKNNGEKFDESFSWDNEIKCDEDQNKKGISFLKNEWKTQNGKERKNSPFGYREKDVLENFTHFEFLGFYDNGNWSHSYYIPVYRCCSSTGSFEYYYDGKVQIIG